MQSNTTRVINAFCGSFLALATIVAPIFSGVANAQLPSHIYELNGTYADSLGGSALTPGTSIIQATGASFNPNPGILVTGGFANPATYSVEMYFRLNTVNSYRRLLDFKNRTSDKGLYVESTRLNFFGGNRSATGLITANQMTHLVFTRDGATQRVNGYLNGSTTPAITFIDSSSLATLSSPNNLLYFFTDDTSVSGESSAGFVDYIRTYDTALSATQAQAVYQSNVLGAVMIPEPSTLSLFGGIASLAMGMVLRRRRKAN